MKGMIIYPKQAMDLLGIGRTAFYMLAQLPDFPKPRNPLKKRPFYLREELEQWVRSQDKVDDDTYESKKIQDEQRNLLTND